MSMYVGISEITACMFIGLLKLKKDGKIEKNAPLKVSLDDVEFYGSIAKEHLKSDGKECYLVLSKRSVTHMFNMNSTYFKEEMENGETLICLNPHVTISDLDKRFRTYLSEDIKNAFEISEAFLGLSLEMMGFWNKYHPIITSPAIHEEV